MAYMPPVTVPVEVRFYVDEVSGWKVIGTTEDEVEMKLYEDEIKELKEATQSIKKEREFYLSSFKFWKDKYYASLDGDADNEVAALKRMITALETALKVRAIRIKRLEGIISDDNVDKAEIEELKDVMAYKDDIIDGLEHDIDIMMTSQGWYEPMKEDRDEWTRLYWEEARDNDNQAKEIKELKATIKKLESYVNGSIGDASFWKMKFKELEDTKANTDEVRVDELEAEVEDLEGEVEDLEDTVDRLKEKNENLAGGAVHWRTKYGDAVHDIKRLKSELEKSLAANQSI